MDIQEIKDKWRLLEIAPIFVETQASQSNSLKVLFQLLISLGGSTVIFPVDVLKKRWAKYGNGQPVKALTQNCEDVSDFIEAIKQKMQRKLDGVDPD